MPYDRTPDLLMAATLLAQDSANRVKLVRGWSVDVAPKIGGYYRPGSSISTAIIGTSRCGRTSMRGGRTWCPAACWPVTTTWTEHDGVMRAVDEFAAGQELDDPSDGST
jgi:hypothetical protein